MRLPSSKASLETKSKVCQDGCCLPPPHDVLKLKIDGSSRRNPRHARIGGVGRDNSGVVHFFFSLYKGQHTNNYIKALAILYALERSCALGWRKICELDSQIVVDMLKNKPQVEGIN